MRIYTTCPGCGDYLVYLGSRHHLTHAFCDDPDEWQWRLERDFVAAVIADDPRADALAGQLDAIGHHTPKFQAAALAYAEWGWPVFPIKAGEKVPATRHGFKDATTDPRIIRQWWTRWPTANVATPTGIWFDVLDVDFPGAASIWPRVRELVPSAHGIAITGNNGLHIVLLPSGDNNLTRAGQLDGIDYRGDGGYVVLPPSQLAGGKRYAWDVKPSPFVKRGAQGRTAPGFPPTADVPERAQPSRSSVRPVTDVELPEFDERQGALFEVADVP